MTAVNLRLLQRDIFLTAKENLKHGNSSDKEVKITTQ
jgi:hypothetical protein